MVTFVGFEPTHPEGIGFTDQHDSPTSSQRQINGQERVTWTPKVIMTPPSKGEPLPVTDLFPDLKTVKMVTHMGNDPIYLAWKANDLTWSRMRHK